MTDQQDPKLLQAELLARVEQARDPYDKAVWRLLTGDPDAGLTTIRDGLPELAKVPANLHLVQIALLADDPTAPALAAAAVDDTLRRFVPGDREYHATILALIAGDEDRARSLEAQLDAFVAVHDKLRGGQPSGVANIPRGLLARDAELLAAGIESLLAWHLRRAKARSALFNNSRGVISLEAISALILGHRRGLTVAIDARYRAARVPLLAQYVTEWQGRSLPRGMPLSLSTDLVAGPWLGAHGTAIAQAPRAGSRPTPAKHQPAPPAPTSPAEQARVLEALRIRIRLGGHPWQVASWLLMLGDARVARGRLEDAGADAHRRWQASVSNAGGLSRVFSKDHAQPNPNLVREHFALALALGDEPGLREAIPGLQAWLRTQEGKSWGIYAHAAGYLDFICDLVAGNDRSRPSRTDVEQVIGPLSSVRVAAIALAERDAALLREGLESMLAEHAKALERKSSPPPPICEPAVHLAAAARRLGVPIQVDGRFAVWPVLVEGARLPCDLLGRAIWSGLG